MVPGPQRHSTIQGKSRVALAINAASRKVELDEGSDQTSSTTSAPGELDLIDSMAFFAEAFCL